MAVQNRLTTDKTCDKVPERLLFYINTVFGGPDRIQRLLSIYARSELLVVPQNDIAVSLPHLL